MARLHTRRSVSGLALLCFAVALVAAFPGRPTGAQPNSEIQTLDDSQIQFARGTFQRTALSPDLNTAATTDPVDQRGAVQLAPIGALRPWDRLAVTLPRPSADAGVVTIGNRLYVIAGDTGTGASADVLWATLDQILGGITPHGLPQGDPRIVNASWANDPLPATTLISGCAFPMAARTRAVAASLTTGVNTGFIYVVGGLAPDSQNCVSGTELTASGVQIGQVAADGEIAWRSGPPLPSDPSSGVASPRGVEQASATLVRTASGKVFLYVIGGLSTFENLLGDSFSAVEKSVWRSEINPATGDLGAWQRDTVGNPATPENVPLLATGAQGIYDHAAAHVTSTAVTQAGSTVVDGIVIAGGYTQPNDAGPNPFVYRATIDPNTGDLTWDSSPSTDNNNVTLGLGGQPGMSGLAYNNKLYMIGGRDSATTTVDWVLTASFDDALNIRPLPGITQYFAGRDTAVLQPEGRLSDTGAALMDALPPLDNPNDGTLGTAWALVVGGNNTSGAPTTAIFRGRIGGDESLDNSDRVGDGWYYSPPFNVTFAQQGGVAKNARVLSIRWAAEINRGGGGNPNGDIIVQFRKTLRADPNCPNDSVFTAGDQWFTLDADTGSPFFSKTSTPAEPVNKVTLKDAFGTPDFVATCFQYRARFTQNGFDANNQPSTPANARVSPKLFSMSIEKVVAGNADIRIPENGFGFTAPGGRLASLDMVIQNLSLDGRDNTQNAGLEGDDGGFFVHLCVAYASPGQPAPNLVLPTLPLAPGAPNPDCFRAYYQVYKWQMTAGAQLGLINSGDQTWKRQTSPTTEETIADIRSLFNQPGTYKVAMIIDARNFVSEGTAGEQNNRGEEAYTDNQPQVLTLEITGPPINLLHLPMVRR